MQAIGWFITGPFIYLAVLIFIFATLYKVISFSKMPRHLRWELYPVPHQGLEGSKYQKVDFYNKKPVFSKAHEMIAMGQEMVFIKKAFDHNRRLWVGTWPLHMGIYLAGVWLALLMVCGAAGVEGQTMLIGSSLVTWILAKFTIIAGAAAFIFGLTGGVVLLVLRYSNEDLRDSTDFVTYFNLYLMTAVFGSGLAAWLAVDPYFDIIRRHIMALLTFKPISVPTAPVIFEMLVFGIFIVYLPFSRMMHFAAKYFFFHNVMWDDEPMKPGSKMERDIAGYLGYKVDWSADHVNSQVSWNDQARQDEGKEALRNEKEN